MALGDRAIVINKERRAGNYYKQKEVLTCAREGCTTAFIAHQKGQKYCSRKCRRIVQDSWRSMQKNEVTNGTNV